MILKSDIKQEKVKQRINWQEPKWRRLRWLCFLLLIVLAFLYYWLHFRPAWALSNFRSQLRGAGEKLSIEDIRLARVSDDQNAAGLFLKAASILSANTESLTTSPPPSMMGVGPGRAMVGWAQTEPRVSPPHTWADLGTALAADSEALQLLHQVIDHPVLDFDLHYDEGRARLDLSHLATLKRSAQLLDAAAMYDLHRGDSRSATTNLLTLLALIKGMERDQLVSSELVRIDLSQIATRATWELLQSTNLDEPHLASLQNSWQRIDLVQSAENALKMERAVSRATLLRLRSEPQNLTAAMTLDHGETNDEPPSAVEVYWNKARLKTKQLVWQQFWSYSDDLNAEQGVQVLLDAMRSAETNMAFKGDLRQADSKLLDLGIADSGGTFHLLKGVLQKETRTFFSRQVLAANKYLHELMVAETAQQITTTAVALKRYQLHTRTYPPDLNSLVPKFLSAVPQDPVDGRPLRYQLTSSSFLLYSIGEDSLDNGGDPSPPKGSTSFDWLAGRDYVWPDPASEREVQIYEQTPANGKN